MEQQTQDKDKEHAKKGYIQAANGKRFGQDQINNETT